MGFKNNLTGKRFSRLIVVMFKYNDKYRRSFWECLCDCGNIKIISTPGLVSGDTKSCGCLNIESRASGNNSRTHGLSKTPEYNSWLKIKERCLDPEDEAYPRYGGRGITVCDEWRNDFQTFYDHIGKKPSSKHSIDRIDNDGNYEPNNIRWATDVTQANNRRNNAVFEYNGEEKTVAQWAEIGDINYKTLWGRLFRSKWSIEKALNTPLLNQGEA